MRMKFFDYILIAILLLSFAACSGLTNEQKAVEIVKEIVINEHKLYSLEIDYSTYKNTTDKYFDKYVSYINDETPIIAYTDDDGLVSYKAIDIDDLKEDERNYLFEKLVEMRDDFLGTTELFISEAVIVDADIFVVVETRNTLEGSVHSFYSWFKLRNEDGNNIKVYATQSLLPLVEVESQLGVKSINFEEDSIWIK